MSLLETPNAFAEQVFLWIESLGLSVERLKKANSLFSEFVLSVSSQKQIHIKLIDFDTYKANPVLSLAELKAHGEQMKQLRLAAHEAVVLWEDVWVHRSSIVKSRILAMLGRSERVPGRLTVVRRIDKQTASQFLVSNHLQGVVSSKTQYALYLPRRYFRVLSSPPEGAGDGDLLLAAATFSHPRIFSRNGERFRSYEMIRFCSYINMTVVGGLDKLIKAFANDFEPGDLMTYADLEWSDGAGYRKLGFEPQKDIEPIPFNVDAGSMARYALSSDVPDDTALIQVINQGSRKYVKSF